MIGSPDRCSMIQAERFGCWKMKIAAEAQRDFIKILRVSSRFLPHCKCLRG